MELTRWYLSVSWPDTPGTAPSQCLVNVSVAEAGNCPAPNNYFNLFCTNLCGHDAHCPGALKCCYDGSCFRCMYAIAYNRHQYRNQLKSNQNQLNFNQNQLKSNQNQLNFNQNQLNSNQNPLNSNQNQQYKNMIQQYQNMIQRYQSQIPRSPSQRSLKNQNHNQQLTNQNQQQPPTAQFGASGYNSNTYRSLRDYQNMIQRYQNQLPPNPSQISSNQNQQSQNQNQQQPRAAQSGATGYNINTVGSQRKYMYTHFGASLHVAVWQF